MGVNGWPKWAALGYFAIGLGAGAGMAQESLSPLDQAFVEQRKNAFDRQLNKANAQITAPNIAIDTVQAKQTQGLDQSVCLPISKIDVSGNNTFDTTELAKIVGPYENQCLSLARLDAVVVDLTNAYFAQGLIATRVYIPDQDISTRTLRLNVKEGEIAAIYWDGQADKKHRQIRAAFPDAIGRVVNLRELERGFEQINALRSQNVKIGLLPGKQAGQSIVNLVDEPASPVFGNYSYVFNTAQRDAEHSHKLTFGLENPIGYNDVVMLSLSQSNDAPLEFDPINQGRRVAVDYRMSYGPFTVNAGMTRYDYHRLDPGLAVASKGQWGNARSYSLGVEYALGRNQTTRSKMTASLTHARAFVEQDFFGTRAVLQSQTRNTTALALGYQRSTQVGAIFHHFDAEIELGLGVLGASPANSIAFGDFARDYRLFSLRYTQTKGIDLWGHAITQNLRLGLQISPDRLLNAQRVVLGAGGQVAAGKSTRGTGNSGIWGGGDWYWAASDIQWRASLDWGMVQDDFSSTSIKAATLGASRNFGNVQTSLTVSQILEKKGDAGISAAITYAF